MAKLNVKKTFLTLAAIFAVVVLVFVVIVAMQPSQFRVTRSAVMAAPPEAVFAQVNDFHDWEAWSPWAKLDPNAKNTFEGPTAGTGSIFRWAGNSEVGEGSMTITESRPHELIRIRLEFVRPMEDVATVEFDFQPVEAGTRVTWSMFGENDFVSKAFCLFMDMDQMLGGDFEKGLAAMKAVVEPPPTDDRFEET
ncbi:MAG: SRPBCC family protein [Planctomycetaceae bacterium]